MKLEAASSCYDFNSEADAIETLQVVVVFVSEIISLIHSSNILLNFEFSLKLLNVGCCTLQREQMYGNRELESLMRIGHANFHPSSHP